MRTLTKERTLMIKLSIIIPCYNAEPYIHELLDVLNKQMSDNIEVLIVDDGSSISFKTDYSWAKVFRKENGGCSTARNMGLDNAKGKYIAFIDADDLVPDNYIDKILEKSKGGYDVIDLSWRSLSSEGAQHDHKLKDDNDWLSNPSVCTRVFKRSFIGDIRFNEKKDSTEDEDFSRKLGYIYKDSVIKHGSITDYLYFYRTAVTNSKIKRFKKGLMKTKRIVYHVPVVSSDRTDLLEEIKKEDELNEVWLLTNQCDIPEMRRYCQIHKPFKIWGHELRGEPWADFEKINAPIKTQVVLFCEYANKVGGISTFIYTFCKEMRKYYDIIVIYEKMDKLQLDRLTKIVKVLKYNQSIRIACDTLILNRLTDKIYSNIYFKKSVQVCHCCRQNTLRIPANRDVLVNVSEAAKRSWKEEAAKGTVIHNMILKEADEMLLLVSATRIGARDKGGNDERMIKLAEKLKEAGIKFVWLLFSDNELKGAPKEIIQMQPTLDIQTYIKKADYLVQLSDEEAYSYSILEALVNGTAVICTPIESAKEQGVKDGVNGYVVPYNMKFDVTKLLSVPQFKYDYSNDESIEKWRDICGSSLQKENYQMNIVSVEVLKTYRDLELDTRIEKGTIYQVREERAIELANKKLCKIL